MNIGTHDLARDRKTLLRALRFPLQLPSLLFIAVSSKARHALHTGRRRLAHTLLRNFVTGLHDQAPGAELLALQRRLAEGVDAV